MHYLNPAQQQAVRLVDRPLLVLAGAGSGKTKVITEKIAYLVRERKMAAPAILAITFTNKAAREMKERAKVLLKNRAPEDEPVISTFHAFGLRFLRGEHARAGLRRNFSIFDPDDVLSLLRELSAKDAKKDQLEMLRQGISSLKNAMVAPDAALAQAENDRDHDLALVYRQYQDKLRAFNAVDFDDLIALPVQLLETNAEVVASWQRRIGYLLVDEYQDTNRAQYRLLKALDRPRFTVVGDDDQSIYAWRGAAPENLRELVRDFPSLEVIKLEQNYRCSRRILRAANALIAQNGHLFEKRLWSEGAEGAPIAVLECEDEQKQAEKIAAEIAYRQIDQRCAWGDFAVLYRGNHQARALEQALRLSKIPYEVIGGSSFFDCAEIKDVMCYLRLVLNPADDPAFLRAVAVPRREVGVVTLAKLAELAAKAGLGLLQAAQSHAVLAQLPAKAISGLQAFARTVDRLAELLQQGSIALLDGLVREIGYAEHLRQSKLDKGAVERKLQNLEEFVAWLKNGLPPRGDAGELSARLFLLNQADQKESANAVRLMTLHSAKGLEFRHVHLVGLEDGSLPHETSIADNAIEEERRLFYVGITRAKETLTLSYAKSKQRFGQTLRLDPSRFLAELPEEDLARAARAPSEEHKQARAHTHLSHLAALLGD